tara:strand:- start:1703 stop:2434 length:732 start_codon:yes stop_codon:yes gene_type:complete
MRYHAIEFADEPLYGLPVAVFDFETTGVDPQACRAVELSIVHLNLGKDNTEEAYSCRFNPRIPIPEGASAVHGIYDQDVVGCKTFKDSWPDIRKHLEGRVLAAYNLSFDWTLLNCEYRRSGLWHPTVSDRSDFGFHFFGICGLVMAKALDDHLRGRGSHRLSAVCDRRGVMLDAAHTASSDALATANLIEVLLREATERYGRFQAVRDFWGWQKSAGIEQERGLREWLRSKGKRNDVWPWTDY